MSDVLFFIAPILAIVVAFNLGRNFAIIKIKQQLEEFGHLSVKYGDFNKREGIIEGKWLQVK